MGGGTITFRIKMPSIKVPSPKVVRLPEFSVKVNPVLLLLLAAVIVYASFENTRLETARLRGDLEGGIGRLAGELSANVTALMASRQVPSPSQTPAIIQTSSQNQEALKSLSLSVDELKKQVSNMGSLDRYYSSKLQTTATVKSAAATAAQKSYIEMDDQCMKLSDSQDDTEKNQTACKNAKSIYYWMRDNVKYEPAYESGYSRGDVQFPSETLSSLIGGSADHALLLVSLLRSRGIDAYLVTIPDADYMIAAARVNGLPDSYPGSISWRTMTSTGIKQPPYEYYGTQKDMVLLDSACRDCLFGKLREKHKDLKMELMAYFNRTGT